MYNIYKYTDTYIYINTDTYIYIYIHMWISTLYFFRTCVFNGILCKILCRHVYVYLDNPLVQNYRLKSETAIIIAGCLNFPVSILFAVSVSTFWALDLFRFVFFCRFVGFFRRFKIGKTHAKWQNTKTVQREKNMSPALIPEKALL